MEKSRKVIGKVSVPRDYVDGETCYLYNVVSLYGSAFMCMVESTTTPPATLQDDGETIVLNPGWRFFADATAARNVGTRVTSLERDLGQYEPLPSVAMTAETTGKYINAEGVFVDDADFNIAAIGAVVVGNTYELYMGGSDKMKQGVALFVARIKTTTTSGTERIEYRPLFSAMSTDIAKSGYVCFEAMEAYSDVLVCYRADVPEATTLLVRRYGTKASIATQINNLKNKVDLKSFADGYYASMRVGSADNLTSKGEATEELIMSRKAGGNNQIEDGSASIKRIKGYSVVLNQMFTGKNADPLEKNGIILREYKGTYFANGTASDLCTFHLSEANFTQIKGHKVLIYGVKGGSSSTYQLYVNYIGEFNNAGIRTIIHEKICSVKMIIGKDYVATNLSITPQIVDLTQMFGSGNEPATPDDFAKRLGYDSIDDVPYIPYNEGEIVSSFAEGIKTTDTEGKVSERKWSETLKKYFPDGLKSAGSAFDEITPTKAVKKIGMVDLSTTTWEQFGNVFATRSLNTIATFGNTNGLCSRYSVMYVTTDPLNSLKDKSFSLYDNRVLYIKDTSFSSLESFKQSLQGVMLDYELAAPEETTYDELNLTEQVAEGGTEEAIITEGKTSTPLRADIVYPIDAYNTIKANKAHIGTLSSLNTASKTDLVSAINELAGKVGALEAKATEVTNETTE